MKSAKYCENPSPHICMLQNGHRKYVLRKKPPGKVLASAHAVEREYQVYQPTCKEAPQSLSTPLVIMGWAVSAIVLWSHLMCI